ncbi:hypothetical protein [Agromyces albus]|uniref:hypothetical protein n=1 Tax=Agromyces albus TaxID=205332 RepID=UPI0027D8A9D0|nr:hypothetical protein [Agromyces albus]
MVEPGYTDIPAVIRVLDGMKLSSSRQTEGAVKTLLRDPKTNSLLTHAEVFLVDKSKSVLKDLNTRDQVLLGIGALALIGVTVATVKGIDYFNERRGAKAKSIEPEAPAEIELYELPEELDTVEKPVVLIIGAEVDISDERVVITVSAEDWTELLRKTVMLNSLEERIWMFLSSVRIEGGDEDVLEWQQRMKGLSPQETADEIRGMLESHPELRDDEDLADRIRILIDGRSDDRGNDPKPLEAE